METLHKSMSQEQDPKNQQELTYLVDTAQANVMRQDLATILSPMRLEEDNLIDITRDLTELFNNYATYTPDIGPDDRITMTIDISPRDFTIDFGLNRFTPGWLSEQRQAYQKREQETGMAGYFDEQTMRLRGMGTSLLDKTFRNVTQDENGRIHLVYPLVESSRP